MLFLKFYIYICLLSLLLVLVLILIGQRLSSKYNVSRFSKWWKRNIIDEVDKDDLEF